MRGLLALDVRRGRSLTGLETWSGAESVRPQALRHAVGYNAGAVQTRRIPEAPASLEAGAFSCARGFGVGKRLFEKQPFRQIDVEAQFLKRRGWRDVGGWGRTSCGPYLGKLLCSGRCLRPARAAPVLAWIGPCRNRRGNGSFRKRAVAAHSRTRFRSEPSAFSSFSPEVELRLRSPEAVRRVIGYNASTMQT